MDFSIKLSNGMILKGIVESPGENIKAVIILVHGIGEHVNRYSQWIKLFNENDMGFVAIDLPGHGRSPGKRGHISSYSIVSEIIDILINSSKQTFPGIPVYIYGHSMGGGLVLQYLTSKNPKIKGAIVTSPWLRLTFEPPAVKLAVALLLNNILPGLVQSSGLNTEYLSNDKEIVRLYKNDPLVHDKISVRLFSIAVSSAKYALENSSMLKVPTLILHGNDDKITSPGGSREFAAKAKNAELKVFEGGFHELHNEPFKQEVFTYIKNWIGNN